MAKRILPDRIFGENVEGAMERALNKKAGEESPPNNPSGEAPQKEGFIYVPEIQLYVAKERKLNGQTYSEAADKIYTQGITIEGERAEMPTPFEFMHYLRYLLSGDIPGLPEQERHVIINDILKSGDYRGNWLNAKFVMHNKGFNNFGMEIFVLNSSGKSCKKIIPLEECLWQDTFADINSGNSQGLLKKPYGTSYEQGKNVYFWFPREGAVARFVADSGRSFLSCSGDPDDSSPSLGVRLVVRPKGAS